MRRGCGERCCGCGSKLGVRVRSERGGSDGFRQLRQPESTRVPEVGRVQRKARSGNFAKQTKSEQRAKKLFWFCQNRFVERCRIGQAELPGGGRGHWARASSRGTERRRVGVTEVGVKAGPSGDQAVTVSAGTRLASRVHGANGESLWRSEGERRRVWRRRNVRSVSEEVRRRRDTPSRGSSRTLFANRTRPVLVRRSEHNWGGSQLCEQALTKKAEMRTGTAE